MAYNFVEELKWRGMIHDIMPDTEEMLQNEVVSGYIGFDPTADSLHIGSMVQIILLMHLQRSGHRPIALVGGATGMIGDPSGKSAERNLLTQDILDKNIAGVKSVISRFIDFEGGEEETRAKLVNNYDWMKDFSLIDFARDIGKHITVNYMMAKESVKKRVSGEGDGMSFTEFTYQLFQGYDYLHLYQNEGVKLQIGGSDQWGNITTGTELVRRVARGKAYALTTPLVTKTDGTKFGKTEGGNIWLDADKTSVYKFYQFWITATDDDAVNWIKIFTFLDKETCEALIEEHQKDPGYRVLQKRLAEEITTLVHGKEAFETAVEASGILFSKKVTPEQWGKMDQATLLEIFDGVPQVEIERDAIANGVDVVTFMNETTGFLSSNGEVRRALKENSLSVNKNKITEDKVITEEDVIAGNMILLQRGKKNYFLVVLK
ncbi:tyrosyl-tRNA synthetase [Nonlabens xylanidelens]|uniref:Tyrosine--tRNA ligase n=1 Tax=Nonlabens xylanidelens TaxID=191564 RepID=A0A2S6IRT0_9FLAO|nr:tyrosine--tRNA ligase [Nonlabens xylanidelens]PPK96982.1 tyrosyl-tRNA synthetase [Nonlabens xylanidelens]PQJ13675.1 tyrosine--tRNA ligase [Nonlabens xylanidelens]